ncbi:MAG TPA: glycosyltransferase family 39 protein [Solirubrobacter sp.]|nr:glycosyltransferase family 39 protein [Solirubrobacter sp.]
MGQRSLRARSAVIPIPAGVAATGAAVVVAAAALALRLSGLGRVAPDPFYDAAVRSMGTSWHDFLFGALEPGGSVAIDKPAVALWPQVVSTKLLGFSTVTLLLPSALAGLASVALLYRLVAWLWGRTAGLAAAAALAVAPLAVLTDRSDTMDALALTLALVSAVLVVAAARAETVDAARGRWLLAGAGAAVGAAFAVKLFQALIPAPALVVLYFAASPLGVGERLSRLTLWCGVAIAVGLAWFVVVSTAPAREQPWAYGSSNGSALSAAFGYDGFARVTGDAASHVGGAASRAGSNDTVAAGAAGPGRLLGRTGGLRSLFGVELVIALGVAALALAVYARGRAAHPADVAHAQDAAQSPPAMHAGDAAHSPPAARAGDAAQSPPAMHAGDAAHSPPAAHAHDAAQSPPAARPDDAAQSPPAGHPSPADRLPRAGALFVATWLVTGAALLSFLPDLKVRYVDVLVPPTAAALGAGVAFVARRRPLPAAALAAILLVIPAVRAVQVTADAQSDSGHLGALTPTEAADLSAYLRPRTQHTRYELASATAAKATPLIERDARPVLMLAAQAGRPITSLTRFKRDVATGRVRYVLIAGPCTPHRATRPGGCGLDARWAVVHGRDVSRAAHLRPHTLYALIPASAGGDTHRRDAQRLALDPHRRRRVGAARITHAVVPARGSRHVRGRRRPRRDRSRQH